MDIDVLLVDDERRVGDLVSDGLERASDGISVRYEPDPAGALAVLDGDSTVDCVVSDYEMPEMDGLELLSAVRAERPDLPFVLFTGKGSEALASEAIAAGATDYVPKRFGEDQYALMANRIENAVEGYRSRRRRERTRERYETLIEHSGGLVTVLDPDLTIQFQSRSVERVLDRSPGSMTGESLAEFVHPEDRSTLESIGEELSTGSAATVENAELRLRRADGEWRHVEVVGTSRTDSVVDGYLLNAIDVTERRKREDQLRSERAFVDSLLDSMSDILYAFDSEGDLFRWNDRLLEVTGYDRSEVVEMAPDEFIAERERSEVNDLVAGVFEGGETVTFEAPLVTSDGEEIPYEFSAAPVRNAAGEVRGAVGFGRDVSDRVERRRELRRKSRAMDEADVGITIADAEADDLPLIYANEGFETTTGYPVEDVLGRNCRFLQGEGTDPENVEEIRDAIAAGESVTVELRNYRPDGTAFWNRLKLTPITDDDGHVTEYVGFQEDVSERKRYQRTLETLHGTSRDLLEADSRERIADVVTGAAERILDADAALVSIYDPEKNALDPVSSTTGTADLVGSPPTFHPGEAIAWDVFVEGEARVYDDVREAPGRHNPDTDVRGEVLIPLGEHGVFVCGSDTVGEFDDQFLELADLLAANCEAALDRFERDRQLRERERELRERNERLRELVGLNERVRSASHDVVEAETPGEVCEVVVETLSSVDWFDFAWVGTDDPESGSIVPEAWAGRERGYLDEVPLSTDADEGPPAVRAVAGGRTVVVDSVADQLRTGEWQRQALTRDFRSSLSVPLVDGDIRYGVLSVYAGARDAFDDDTVAVIESFADTVAATLSSVERRQGRAGDRRTDLAFTLDGGDSALLAALDRIEGPVTVDGVVTTGEDVFAYGTATDATATQVRTACDDVHGVESVTTTTASDGTRIEFRLSDAPVVRTVLDNGGRFRSLAVDEWPGTLTVTLSSPDRVRPFVESICDQFRAELRSRRDRDGSDADGFGTEALTDRQMEVLAVAYHNGYYEWPRRRNSEEIAESVGVSKATFLEHLRRAESVAIGRFVDEASLGE